MQSTSELELVGEREEPFVRIRESLLCDKRFTLGEKLFIARISGFKTYVESNEHCAEFLGVSIATIKRAKTKLIELGALEEISFNGKKKTFIVKLERLFDDEPAQNDDGSKRTNSQLKMSQQPAQNEPHIIKNKEKVKEKKNIDSKESILAQKPNDDVEEVDDDSTKCEKQTEFGNADINEAFRLWEDATGFDLSSNKFERRTMFNLLRRKDVKTLGGFKPLVSLVKEARCMDSRFAPKIAKPSELGGKYSKFEKLIDWSKSRGQNQTQSFSNHYEPDTAIIGTYYKPHPEVVERREEPRLTAEEEEQEKAKRHEECEAHRASFMQRVAQAKIDEQERSRQWRMKRMNKSRL